MAAGTWTLTSEGRTKLIAGEWVIGTDTFKMALFLSTSNLGAASTTFAGVTNEVGETNTGYTAGGGAVTLSVSGTTTVTCKQSAGVQWTAGSANLTARFACIYEVAGRVLCYCLLESPAADVTATNGNTLTVGGTDATVFTLA